VQYARIPESKVALSVRPVYLQCVLNRTDVGEKEKKRPIAISMYANYEDRGGLQAINYIQNLPIYK